MRSTFPHGLYSAPFERFERLYIWRFKISTQAARESGNKVVDHSYTVRFAHLGSVHFIRAPNSRKQCDIVDSQHTYWNLERVTCRQKCSVNGARRGAELFR